MAGMMHDAEGGNGADLGPGLFAAADQQYRTARSLVPSSRRRSKSGSRRRTRKSQAQ